MKFTFAFALLVPLFSYAQNSFLQGFSLDVIEPQVDCFDPKTTPACTDINRAYCTNLAANEGNMTDSTGVIRVGKSQKSQLSEIERANLVDLTRSVTSLPADLRNAIQGDITKLQKLIDTENDSRNWYRDVSRTRNNIAYKVRDLAEKKADVSLREKLPRGQRATSADTAAERDLRERELFEIISRAKFETSPNWGKLNSVLTQVKEDMLSVIDTLPLTAAEKAERVRKVYETNLTSPFGLRIGGVLGRIMEQDCRTNMVNAMYMAMDGSLTVCAGFLNGYQSESALYFTLAHELAHSFNLNQLQNQNSSPRWSLFNQRLIETNANIPCDEYERVTNLSRNQESYQCGSESYNKFLGCLTGLTPSTLPVTGPYQDISAYNKVNLCGVTDRSQGLAYMNPNEFADRNFARLVSGREQEYTGRPMENARGMLSPAYEIVQEKRCHPEKTCEEVLRTATLRVQIGTTTPACMSISQRGQENESDWYAHKAVILRMRKTTDLRQRREMAAASMVFFCPFRYMRTPTEKQVKELEREMERMAEEDNGDAASQDHHSSNDERTNAIMTEEMASLLQCTRPAETTSYQGCRL